MAEEVTNVTNDVTEAVTDNVETKAEEKGPSVDELLAKLALAEAEKSKLKSANDKLSKESAEWKRQQRASMTAEEQKNAEIEERIKELTERAELAEKENNHNKAIAAYKNISDGNVVETLIGAISDADHEAIAKIIESEVSKAVKVAQAEWLKTRPSVNNGSGVSMTKEEIMAIKDSGERQRAIAQNLELFTN